MTDSIVRIWFEGDIGPASITYLKKFIGAKDAGEYLVREDAKWRFPNASKIEVEIVENLVDS